MGLDLPKGTHAPVHDLRARTDYPGAGGVHGVYLWSFVPYVCSPSPIHFSSTFSLCSSLTLTLVFLTTIPTIFEGLYGQEPGIAGLHYLALGVGLTGGSQINARALDRLYKHLKEKNGGVQKPEYRLRESGFLYFLKLVLDLRWH